MELVDEDVFMVDGEVAELLDIDDMDLNSTGVAFLSATKTAVHLIRQKKTAKSTKLPCCIVCKQLAFDAGSEQEKVELKTYFKPKSITLHFKEKNGPPKPYKCLVFQLGEKAVYVRDTDQDDVVVVQSDRPLLTKLAVWLVDHSDRKDFDKLKDNFDNEAVSAIGAKLLPPDGKVKFARTKLDYVFLKKTVHVHQGYTFVDKNSKEAVLKRSGHNGYLIQECFRNEEFTILRPKERPSLENARKVAKLLGDLNFGVVVTAGGFAVRVKCADKDFCLLLVQ